MWRRRARFSAPIHGAFWQTPGNHVRGTMCPACSNEHRKVSTFKRTCQRLGVNYWRALKRREAGMSEEKIFAEAYVRDSRETIPITVWGVTYPNIEEAIRVLGPPATSTTIKRWIAKGLSPEQAFRDVPLPAMLRHRVPHHPPRIGEALCGAHHPNPGAALEKSPRTGVGRACQRGRFSP